MFSRIKTAIWSHYLAPLNIRHNWRPAEELPLDPQYDRVRMGFDDEDLIRLAVSQVSDNTMASFERLATLWHQTRYLDRYGVPGALVECGVWQGGCIGLMALAHMHSGKPPTREIHVFDSFEGLPQPDRRVDGELAIAMADGQADGRPIPIGCCTATQEDCRQLLIDRIGYPADLVKFHVGWFEATIPATAPSLGPIGLLRLDGDWYSSTKVCLDHLAGQVAQNGVIVVDDYGHFPGCKQAVDEFIAANPSPILLNHIDYTGRYWIKN